MFRLSKWYLDCVADGGDTAILYWASLRWGPVRLRYGAALLHLTNTAGGESVTLRPGGPPKTTADHLSWRCDRLGVTGEWQRQTPSIARTLFEHGDGTVHWHCCMPRAVTSLRVGTHTLAGLGYAEHLSMTLPPTRLPCDVLRWGRYLAPDDDLVWIAWWGDTPRTWAFRRGTEHEVTVIEDDRLELDSATLGISDNHELRSGRLHRTALRPLAALVRILPRWRRATETKWRARGTLTESGSSKAGWIIHEVVRWP